MHLGVLILPYLIFILSFAIIKNVLSRRHTVRDDTLDENLKTADQYEIAFLKGGKNLSVDLAFFHLLNSGYLEKSKSDEPASPTYRFQFIEGKDTSSLHSFEKEIIARLNTPTALHSLYSQEYASLKKYQQKLSNLHLLQVTRKTIGFLWKAYTYIAWALSIAYLVFGKPAGFFLKAVFVIIINLISVSIIWSKILCKESYFDGMLLTSAGEKYIKIFEKKCFPLPDFKSDQSFKEAQELNPCS